MMLEHEYDTMRRVEDTHWWYRTLRQRVLRDLKRALRGRDTARILDDGCGTGGMLAYLKEKGEVKGDLFHFPRIVNSSLTVLSQNDMAICRRLR